MVIEVNKDIDRYQESVAMGLTARQLIFSIASVIVGGGIVLLLYKYISFTSCRRSVSKLTVKIGRASCRERV